MNPNKKKNWFRRHWVISIFLGLIVLGMINSVFNNLSGNEINEEDQNNNIINSIQEETQNECIPSWNCDEWSVCSKSEIQTRTCIDFNDCGTKTNKPAESQKCVYEYSLEEVLPQVSNFPTEYNRDSVEEIEKDDGNIKVYDTNNGFVKGKKYLFSKYEVVGYSFKDYFDVEIMFYEFKNSQDALNFKTNIENYMKEQGGYSELKLDTEGNCFNTKEDYGFSGGNIASSTCQKGNIIYWTILGITNSFKDSEDYIENFIEVTEDNFN